MTTFAPTHLVTQAGLPPSEDVDEQAVLSSTRVLQLRVTPGGLLADFDARAKARKIDYTAEVHRIAAEIGLRLRLGIDDRFFGYRISVKRIGDEYQVWLHDDLRGGLIAELHPAAASFADIPLALAIGASVKLVGFGMHILMVVHVGSPHEDHRREVSRLVSRVLPERPERGGGNETIRQLPGTNQYLVELYQFFTELPE